MGKAKEARKRPVVRKDPAKPKVEYTWDRQHGDVGRVVFTPYGKAVIRGHDATHSMYEIQIEGTEVRRAMATKRAKFKAFNEDYREDYRVDKSVRTPSGAFSVSNGDQVAKALNGLDEAQIAKVASLAGAADRLKKWAGLNPGMRRMNLGNVMRGLVASEDRQVKAKAEGALREAAKMPRTEKVAKPRKAKGRKAA